MVAKMPTKQEGHLLDWTEGELILRMHPLRGPAVGGECRAQHDRLAHEVVRRQKHSADHHEEKEHIDDAIEPPRIRVFCLSLGPVRNAVKPALVKQEKDCQQGPGGDERYSMIWSTAPKMGPRADTRGRAADRQSE